MKEEKELKAKVNHLKRVLDKVLKRKRVFLYGGSYSTLDVNDRRIFSTLSTWTESLSIQINALEFAIGDVISLEEIKNKRLGGVELHEVMDGEDYFAEEPNGFVIRFCTGDYLSGWSIENKGGKSWNKLEGTIYRHEAVEFRGVKEDEVKYITDNLTGKWEFEYIYE